MGTVHPAANVRNGSNADLALMAGMGGKLTFANAKRHCWCCMALQLRICRISPHEVNLEPLRQEAAREGFRCLDRLLDDWLSGRNRFEKTGEELLGAYAAEQLVAVGGLNRDPYEPAPRTARLRHLYVHPAYRRTGLGKTVVRHLLSHAGSAFDELRLRTDNPTAAVFYEALGFEPVDFGTATHLLKLKVTPRLMSAMGRKQTLRQSTPEVGDRRIKQPICMAAVSE